MELFANDPRSHLTNDDDCTRDDATSVCQLHECHELLCRLAFDPRLSGSHTQLLARQILHDHGVIRFNRFYPAAAATLSRHRRLTGEKSFGHVAEEWRHGG